MKSVKSEHMRVAEFAKRSGWQVSTVRKKLQQRLIGYRKVGRIVLIPESELNRVLGDYRPPIALER